MRSTVIISRSQRQGFGKYEITVTTETGRVIPMIAGGNEAGEAAGKAAKYAAEHCMPNPMGGDVVGCAEVINLIPTHLLSVPPASERKHHGE